MSKETGTTDQDIRQTKPRTRRQQFLEWRDKVETRHGSVPEKIGEEFMTDLDNGQFAEAAGVLNKWLWSIIPKDDRAGGPSGGRGSRSC